MPCFCPRSPARYVIPQKGEASHYDGRLMGKTLDHCIPENMTAKRREMTTRKYEERYLTAEAKAILEAEAAVRARNKAKAQAKNLGATGVQRKRRKCSRSSRYKVELTSNANIPQ